MNIIPKHADLRKGKGHCITASSSPDCDEDHKRTLFWRCFCAANWFVEVGLVLLLVFSQTLDRLKRCGAWFRLAYVFSQIRYIPEGR